MQSKGHGFTIIEVMMFLAISSLLLMGVFMLSGNLINGTRFTDSVRGLEGFLQRQYDEVSSGVNTRDNTGCLGAPSTPGTSNCLLLGKVIVFRITTDTVDTYNVIGSEPAVQLSNPSLELLLASYNPQTVLASQASYTIPWGAKIRAGKRDSDNNSVNAVALLRSPASSQFATYHFTAPASGVILLKTAIPLNATSASFDAFNTTGNYCIDGQDTGSNRAAITFGKAQGSTAIDTIFGFTVGSPGAPC